MVQLSLKGRDGSRKIEALCFPSLCLPLTATIDISLYPYLLDLQLSDLNFLEGRQSDSSIDILIGSDCYFDILTGEIVRGESGPVAINSELRWAVSGPTNDMASGSGTSSVDLLIEESDHSYSTPMKFVCKEDESELSNLLYAVSGKSNRWELRKKK